MLFRTSTDLDRGPTAGYEQCTRFRMGGRAWVGVGVGQKERERKRERERERINTHSESRHTERVG